MPVTTAILNTCRATIAASPELATFRTAHAAFGAASRSGRPALWQAVYGNGSPTSPAYLLSKTIRDIVTNQAATSGGVSPTEREEAYRTLVAEFVPQSRPPKNSADEAAELQALLLEDQMS